MVKSDYHLTIYPTNACDTATGYGRVEVGLAAGLQRAGVRIGLAPMPDAPVLVVGNPTYANRPHVAGQRLWLYTMSETTAPSSEWIARINACYERVLVPVDQLADYYRKAGVRVPIHAVGLGVDLFPIAFRKRRYIPGTPFIVMTYTYGDMRKGADLAYRAFCGAFADVPEAQLVIKARECDAQWLHHIQLDKRVIVVGGRQSEDVWRSMLYRAHVFVFPSRGEGFGLPPREAVLSGCPAIATRWLGMSDVGNWGYGVDVVDFWPHQIDDYTANARGALWSQPDVYHVEQHLCAIYEHYTIAQQVTEAGREYLMNTATWDQVAQRIITLLETTHGD